MGPVTSSPRRSANRRICERETYTSFGPGPAIATLAAALGGSLVRRGLARGPGLGGRRGGVVRRVRGGLRLAVLGHRRAGLHGRVCALVCGVGAFGVAPFGRPPVDGA